MARDLQQRGRNYPLRGTSPRIPLNPLLFERSYARLDHFERPPSPARPLRPRLPRLTPGKPKIATGKSRPVGAKGGSTGLGRLASGFSLKLHPTTGTPKEWNSGVLLPVAPQDALELGAEKSFWGCFLAVLAPFDAVEE